ncbi:ABC transporter ATP-binding protein [Lysobacter gummosus]|uniref:ATP-binding cassette domain-containing protein n=1 Tax=Lysobacter gummosus TaxID=262324 RepID=A0ABY3XDX2_9GAMM|nr:ATP-binding cassette domain-containing protein [Lysobacter gummosus]ALN92794.1 ABC transporter family protein [Lysobacter gummosus]UNP28343.1 ATP-binding cassette domain-containing protein [Lysobacter gummosus]
MTTCLRAHHVSLELPVDMQNLSGGRPIGLRSSLSGTTRRYSTVLSSIDFAAEEGDRIALIGLNGAGKTTLLRVLNGAFIPTRGVVESRGRMQSLLSPTLGFAEHASVSENVFLRGTAMGLRRRQLQSALAGILEFAGLHDRANHRLNTLSAGQKTRLGFAISTAVQPDILLMDEWISAGDGAFLSRAQDRMKDRFHGSRIVVLAGHSSDLHRTLCNKALVLEAGRMRYFGAVEEGLSVYREMVSQAGGRLREQVAARDPLLFGDISGFVEKIRLREGLIEVEGWAIGDRGREVEVLCVEIDGESRFLERFDRVERDDVLRATAKRSGRFGFRFALGHPDSADPADIAVRLRVSAGMARNRLGAPLQMVAGGIVEAA